MKKSINQLIASYPRGLRKREGVNIQKKSRQILLLTIGAAVIASVLLLNSLCTGAPINQNVTLTINSTQYNSNNESIPVNWGKVNFGCNTKTVTITNNAQSDLTIHLAVSELPAGWALNFLLEDKILKAGESANGTLTLVVPADTLAGNYQWHACITLS